MTAQDEQRLREAHDRDGECGRECDHTDADLVAMNLGRCGPLRYGGPCWLMPGHRGPHHCYRGDVEAVVLADREKAVQQARAEVVELVEAVLDGIESRDGEPGSWRRGVRHVRVRVRAALREAQP